ncbi:hypothetical protein BV25DRAFT_1282862 [Artomyces pyxidatus]|uniref:Uncharacterized protein n=1 Tax=Artomyces pyxidatus TaxID=48021 RepID=A0ACB8SQ08_9AGAM|nr:hypothetical protein BV25DRAFT_1282862 [Artomyces pyxidatus]
MSWTMAGDLAAALMWTVDGQSGGARDPLLSSSRLRRGHERCGCNVDQEGERRDVERWWRMLAHVDDEWNERGACFLRRTTSHVRDSG